MIEENAKSDDVINNFYKIIALDESANLLAKRQKVAIDLQNGIVLVTLTRGPRTSQESG